MLRFQRLGRMGSDRNNAFKQPARIFGCGIEYNLSRLSLIYDLSVFHNHYAVADRTHQREVVRNENYGHVLLLPYSHEEPYHLRLRSHIERARYLIAEDLEFPDSPFDVVVSRNLTWNLPHPETAYSEWCRVLHAGGLLLNFDSNWYNYLFDDAAKEKFKTDRLRSAELGLGDQNIGENFDVMEDITRSLPLSALTRPVWDEAILTQLGMDIRVNRGIWKKVWTLQEQTNFSSTPMFMITAFK